MQEFLIQEKDCTYKYIRLICIQIQAVNEIGIKIADVVNRHKSADFRIIISCLQEVEACFCIVVVRTVTERVKRCDFCCRFIKNNSVTLTPSIVLIFYNNCPSIVKKSNNVCLCIFSVEIRCISLLSVLVAQIFAIALDL